MTLPAFKEVGIILLVVGVMGTAVWFIAEPLAQQRQKQEQDMIAKCTPSPQLYECQLYLAEQGKRDFDTSAYSTGLITGMASGMAISGGRK